MDTPVLYQTIADLYGSAHDLVQNVDEKYNEALQLVANFSEEEKADMFYKFYSARTTGASVSEIPNDVIIAVAALQKHVIDGSDSNTAQEYVDENAIQVSEGFATVSNRAGHPLIPNI